MASILVVEDEETLAESLRYNLAREGYEVTVVADGRMAIESYRRRAVDLVVLDLMLPGLAGWMSCATSAPRRTSRVVVVTAKDAEADVVAGLELGADDYVTKPFSMRELISRIRGSCAGRRGSRATWTRWCSKAGPSLSMWTVTRFASTVNWSTSVPRSSSSSRPCWRARAGWYPARCFSRRYGGVPFFGDPKTLDVHIRRLREKVEDIPRSPEWIVTVRGLGYKFVDGR